MGKGKSFFGGFVIGGIAAGITVLLSTPKPGKEVRKDIKNKWENTNANIIDMKVAVDSVKDSVGEFTKKSIPTLQSTVREVKMIINTWKDEIQPNIQHISENLKALNDERSKASASN